MLAALLITVVALMLPNAVAAEQSPPQYQLVFENGRFVKVYE